MDAEYHVTSAKCKSHPNVSIKSQGDILTTAAELAYLHISVPFQDSHQGGSPRIA